MDSPSDAFEKKERAAKSRDDLVRLLLKLNALLKEKLGLSQKKEPARNQTDMMIIIMTRQEDKASQMPPRKALRTSPSQGDWLENLFAEIEGSSLKRRKNS